jgi:phosphate-selective porin OprO and OprP
VTYTIGFMYDGALDEFAFRETGVMVAVPRLLGYLFVGRTKEGYSLMKVMSGYAVFTPERSTINDATIPILAGGIKWLGYAPNAHFVWNLGFYADSLSEDASFATSDRQVSGRFGWVPVIENDGGTLLQVGVSGRIGKPDNDSAPLRSARKPTWRPSSSTRSRSPRP